MTKPLPHTKAGRRAKQKTGAAVRMRTYRANLKSKGLPPSAVLDRAVVEALAFHVGRNKHESGGVNIGSVDVVAMMATATIVLEREGYAPEPAGLALKARMKRVASRHQDPACVPSLNPGPIDRIRPPKGGQGWQTPLPVILQHLAGPNRNAMPRPESRDTPVTPSHGVVH